MSIENDEPALTVEQWLKLRRDAASQINPETAEVMWMHAQTMDPYGVDPDLPEELQQVGRVRFARSPGSDFWVWFGDLKADIADRLVEMHRDELCLFMPRRFLGI